MIRLGRYLSLLCALGCFPFPVSVCLAGQVKVRSKVEEALESKWTTRTDVRRTVQGMGDDGFEAVVSIATDARQPYLRRWHAVLLLGTFDNRKSAEALSVIAKDKTPAFRCFALQSITELGEQRAVPVLIGRLDDNSVCMNTVVTDPARKYNVYVSDEAVRLLEVVTGKRFEKQPASFEVKHRATEPWRMWWAKNKQRYASPD